MSDQLNLLFKRIADGDTEAFKEVFDGWYEPLFNTALAYTKLREVAGDVVQQVFLKLWERREILRDVDDARSWLYTVARFQSFHTLKKEMKQEDFSERAVRGMHEQVVITPEEAMTISQIEITIHQSLQRLTEKQRLAYLLSRNEGLTYKQIAQQWGVSIPTVKEHVSKAVKFITEQLKPFRDRLVEVIFYMSIFFF